jgi:hypothetical protein
MRFLLIVSLTLSERGQGARQLGKEVAIPARRARQVRVIRRFAAGGHDTALQEAW